MSELDSVGNEPAGNADLGSDQSGGGSIGDRKRGGRKPTPGSPRSAFNADGSRRVAGHARLRPADLTGPPDARGDSRSDTGDANTRTRSRRARSEKEAPLRVENLVIAWSVAGLTAATLSGVPEFQLNEDQCKGLGEASANALRHLPTGLTEKQQDFGTLLFSVVSVAIVQFRAYSDRVRSERARDITPTPADAAREAMSVPTDAPQGFAANEGGGL